MTYWINPLKVLHDLQERIVVKKSASVSLPERESLCCWRDVSVGLGQWPYNVLSNLIIMYERQATQLHCSSYSSSNSSRSPPPPPILLPACLPAAAAGGGGGSSAHGSTAASSGEEQMNHFVARTQTTHYFVRRS